MQLHIQENVRLVTLKFKDFCKTDAEEQFDENKYLNEQTRFIYDKLKDIYIIYKNFEEQIQGNYIEENNLLVSTITAPLGVKDRLGDLIAIRHPMYGNPDGSMNIGANLAVNTAVIQMEASVDELISSTGRTMKELNKEMSSDIGA